MPISGVNAVVAISLLAAVDDIGRKHIRIRLEPAVGEVARQRLPLR